MKEILDKYNIINKDNLTIENALNSETFLSYYMEQDICNEIGLFHQTAWSVQNCEKYFNQIFNLENEFIQRKYGKGYQIMLPDIVYEMPQNLKLFLENKTDNKDNRIIFLANFKKESWTNENITLFIDNIKDYEKYKDILDLMISLNLSNNRYCLNKLLERGHFEYIKEFIPEIFDDKSINIYIDYIVSLDKVLVPPNILGSYTFAQAFYKRRLFDHAIKFDYNLYTKEQTEELYKYGLNNKIESKSNERNSVEYSLSFVKYQISKIASTVGKETRDMLNRNNLTKLEDKIIDIFWEFEPDHKLLIEYVQYIVENLKTTNIEELEKILVLYKKLFNSNSSIVQRIKMDLMIKFFKNSNCYEEIAKLEDIFLNDNIPYVGKIFKCFKILNPKYDRFNEEIKSTDYKYCVADGLSPILTSLSDKGKDAVIFADLLRATLGSNNIYIKKYIKLLNDGLLIYLGTKENSKNYEDLEESEQKTIKKFVNCIVKLFDNLQNKQHIQEKNSPIDTIDTICKEYQISAKDLVDVIIRKYTGIAGFDTLDELKNYIEFKNRYTNERNFERSKQPLKLNKGDFIKGLGDVSYLTNILQNGSVSKEFLGNCATTDSTPLDTDVSMILEDNLDIRNAIEKSSSSRYGPLYAVIRNDDRFNITRKHYKENLETINKDYSKLETYFVGLTGDDHYAIRTAFAQSEIYELIIKKYDKIIGYELAKNKAYIPVYDFEGNILVTSDDYNKLREQMTGLSHYGFEDYKFSEMLENPDIENFSELKQIENINFTNKKRNLIYEILKQAIKSDNLKRNDIDIMNISNEIDSNLENGTAEIIDIGSTGRNTNQINEGDFDLMIRLDCCIVNDPRKMGVIRETILNFFKKENIEEIILTNMGDLRLKRVSVNGLEEKIDIDISFSSRVDSVTYTSDMCINDRLKTIKSSSLEKYYLVNANILYAKKYLKESKTYKSKRSEISEGGLGAIGIENWILQHGGSFIEAAMDFLDVAEGKTFDEFVEAYEVWDFGENYLLSRNDEYSFNNFVNDNMNEEGYVKMVQALKKYVDEYQRTHKSGLKK